MMAKISGFPYELTQRSHCLDKEDMHYDICMFVHSLCILSSIYHLSLAWAGEE